MELLWSYSGRIKVIFFDAIFSWMQPLLNFFFFFWIVSVSFLRDSYLMQDKNFEFFFLSQVKLKQIKEMFVSLHLFGN